MRGEGRGLGGCGVSDNKYNCAHGAQLNFGDKTPYLTYATNQEEATIANQPNFLVILQPLCLVASLYFLYCCLYSLVFLWTPKLWVLAVSGLIYMLGKQIRTVVFFYRGLKVQQTTTAFSFTHPTFSLNKSN
jgi:hypothetical protein